MRNISYFLLMISFIINSSFALAEKKDHPAEPNKDAVVQTSEKAESAKMTDKEKLEERQKYEHIIQDYKTFMLSISPAVRKEIVEYRIANAKLTQEKRELFKRLSQEAQNYFTKEREYKKKLPLKFKRQVLNEMTPKTEEKTPEKAEDNAKKSKK